jgi:hypothetical protein
MALKSLLASIAKAIKRPFPLPTFAASVAAHAFRTAAFQFHGEARRGAG